VLKDHFLLTTLFLVARFSAEDYYVIKLNYMSILHTMLVRQHQEAKPTQILICQFVEFHIFRYFLLKKKQQPSNESYADL